MMRFEKRSLSRKQRVEENEMKIDGGIILLFLTFLFFSQSAFGAMPQDVTIDSITVNTLTLDLVCTDPKVTGSTVIIGYRLDIDDSILFDSINIIDETTKTCDGVTLNPIDISSLAENTLYNLRLTVSTNNEGDSVDTDIFTALSAPQTFEITLTDSILISDGITIVSHFKITLTDSISITDSVIIVHTPTPQVFVINLTDSISIIDFVVIVHIPASGSPFEITITDSISITDSVTVLLNGEPIGGPQVKSGGGDSDHKWRTMPTFGKDHTILGKQIVENGLIINKQFITITDNFHTEYTKQELETGLLNTMTVKAFSPRGLKMVEFMFGVPELGKHYMAETTVEIWLDDRDPLIIINQKDNLIRDDVMALKKDVRCNNKDPTMCESIIMFFTFNESPLSSVFAIQAIDLVGRNIITTLNEGIDVTGESLNPPKIEYKADGKNGLVLMTQQDKQNELWIDPNEILYTKNSAESWIRISPVKIPIVQDDWKVEERHISYWKEKMLYEEAKAKYVFDSSKIQNIS